MIFCLNPIVISMKYHWEKQVLKFNEDELKTFWKKISILLRHGQRWRKGQLLKLKKWHFEILQTSHDFETKYLRDGCEFLHKFGCVLKLCVWVVTPVNIIHFQQEIRCLILGIYFLWHISYDLYIILVEFRAFTLAFLGDFRRHFWVAGV